jgi:hypothetical protein
MADVLVENRQQELRVNFALFIVYQAWPNLTVLKHFNQRLQYNVGHFCVQRDAHKRFKNVHFLQENQILFSEFQFMFVHFSQK